jgi:hypothetical protein
MMHNAVRDAQRRLAELESAHRHAVNKFDRAVARRAAVVAAHDRLVRSARETVEQTVITMADSLGVELTATLVNLDPRTVRRMARSAAREVASRASCPPAGERAPRGSA